MSLTQFLPTVDLFMIGFYLIYKWIAVHPTAHRFQSYFSLKNDQLFKFFLTHPGKKRRLLILRVQIKCQTSRNIIYSFLLPSSFQFSLNRVVSHPNQTPSLTFYLEKKVIRLNALFCCGHFDLPGL